MGICVVLDCGSCRLNNKTCGSETDIRFLLYINRVILHAFLFSPEFFQSQIFRKILSGILSVSNSLDPDLGDNCIQNLHLGIYIVRYNVRNLVLR